MSAVASTEMGFGGAARPTRRRISFSPFDPNTPHLRFAVVSILLLWLIVLSVLNILPKHYVSKSALIVPGASTSVNVALDKIGQASSAPVSAYNTGALSPKVIYREIAQSDEIRADAARALGVSPGSFGTPRIKLIDETALIQIEMRSADPNTAQLQNAALIDALQRRLTTLRYDELDRRSATVAENLKVYEAVLTAAREKVAQLQMSTGLHSAAQFNELAVSLIQRTRRLSELRSDLDRMGQEQAILSARLGIEPKAAAIALKLVGDPTLAKWIGDYADASVALNAEKRRLGSESPVLIQLQKRLDSIVQQLDAATERNGLENSASLEMLLLLTNNSHQADLFKRLVGNDASLEGRRTEVATTTREVETLEREHTRLGKAAADLEDLNKARLVAEAVFTTAMARISTSKSDIFGSYPLVQVLAAPSLPTSVAGSQGLTAIAGGVLGTILLALAWFLAWLRIGSGPKILKSA
jgi:uncharacterized protein involved in exopolysaccharide biosynthesis